MHHPLLFTRFLLFIALFLVVAPAFGQNKWGGRNGSITFVSKAPLETISATSGSLRGVLDEGLSFSFQVPIASFQGFNSALQREHFNENYMEAHLFPYATFKGKIIEDVFSDPDISEIRAKGKLFIHGIEVDRIIRCTFKRSDQEIVVTSTFPVLLIDHGIQIPGVVLQKIAEEITVEVALTLKPVDSE